MPLQERDQHTHQRERDSLHASWKGRMLNDFALKQK